MCTTRQLDKCNQLDLFQFSANLTVLESQCVDDEKRARQRCQLLILIFAAFFPPHDTFNLSMYRAEPQGEFHVRTMMSLARAHHSRSDRTAKLIKLQHENININKQKGCIMRLESYSMLHSITWCRRRAFNCIRATLLLAFTRLLSISSSMAAVGRFAENDET